MTSYDIMMPFKSVGENDGAHERDWSFHHGLSADLGRLGQAEVFGGQSEQAAWPTSAVGLDGCQHAGPEEDPEDQQEQPQQWLPAKYAPEKYFSSIITSAPRQLDCFTIALGKKTGTTFPITFDNKHNYNALYDTGTGASLINYSAYVSLGQDLDTGYQPFMKNASGEDMGALGQVTCTFTINNQPFTQFFIVDRHMQ